MKKIRNMIWVCMAVCLLGIPVISGILHPVRVEAASTYTGWKQSNGYWYYLVNGIKQSGWVELNDKKYYLMPTTHRMVIGRKKIDGVLYAFDKTGAMREKKWVKDSKGNMYYFQEDGTGVKSDWLTYKNQQYWFGSNYRMATGFVEIGGKTYYFTPKTVKVGEVTYRMGSRRVGWMKINAKRYYFSPSKGYMFTGIMSIQGKKYNFGDEGIMKTGWYTDDSGDKYYFNSPNGEMAVSVTKQISGATWKFDENGVGTKIPYTINSKGQPVVYEGGYRYTLEPEFLSHPGVEDGTLTDEKLLAAVVYCEAENQNLAGMTAVALSILNRAESISSYFPDTLRYVIYQENQYSIVGDGALLRRLKNPDGTGAAQCQQAVAAAKTIMNTHKQSGTNRQINGISVAQMGGKTDFDCVYFMTPSAFEKAGLNWDACEAFQYNGYVYFSKWVYQS